MISYVLGETVKQLLGNELNPIVKQWKERGYLITDKDTYTKGLVMKVESREGTLSIKKL